MFRQCVQAIKISGNATNNGGDWKYWTAVLTWPKPQGLVVASAQDGAARPRDPPGDGRILHRTSPRSCLWETTFPAIIPLNPSLSAIVSLNRCLSRGAMPTSACRLVQTLPPRRGCSRARRRRFVIPCPSWATLPFKNILNAWNWDFCNVGELTAEDDQRKTEGGRLLPLHAKIVQHLVWARARAKAPAGGGTLAETGKGLQEGAQKTSAMARGRRLLSPPSRTETLLFVRGWCVFSSQCQGQNGNTGLFGKVMWEALPA